MAGGLRAEGASDVSLHGVGNAYVTIGLEGNPNLRDQLGDAGAGFGRLVRLGPNGRWSPGAQLASYEASANPDGRQLDSDPYGLLAEAGGQVVVDAGGNSLLRVAPNGDISTIAVLPTLPLTQVVSGDPVPTCVAAGPDGAYYVGILSGAPFRDGLARIYRVVPGEAPVEFRTGFKTVVDIDFDPQGNLYVLQHSSGPTGVAGPGSLLRLTPDGTRATVLGGLSQPTSVAIGPDGAVYVTEFGTSPGIGRVLRLDLAKPVPAVTVGQEQPAPVMRESVGELLGRAAESIFSL
jgi:sugar lactone lactonase YvrE